MPEHSGGGRIRLAVIAGPTATGKSALALALADRLGGEIINADSRQIYRGMDIGTAKPSASDRLRVPHHLYGLIRPDEPFTLTNYLALARQAITDIAGRGKLPILTGGSGLYVRAVLRGMAPPAVPPNPSLRAALEQQARTAGVETLLAELQAADPLAAGRIDPRNLRRIIRALEVIRMTGKPFSAQGAETPPPYDAIQIGLTLERNELYRRIDARVDAMIAAGLVDEVRGLLAAGYRPDLPAFSSLGYREILAMLRGEMTLAEAVTAIKHHTHRFARQQYTWFRLDDPAITWFAAGLPDLAARAAARLQPRRI